MDFPRGSVVKNPPAMQEPQETQVQSLGRKDPLGGKEWQATPSFLPGESPWTEESGGLQTTGSKQWGMTEATLHIYVHH